MAKIAQRLIAAGASPERAAAFEKQFTAARPGLKPREIQDAFDADLAAFAAAQFPSVWRPQTLSDAQLPDYIIGTYGQQKYDDLTKKAAPFFNAALNSQNQYIKDIAAAAQQGISVDSVISSIRNDALEDETLFGGLTEADVVSQANKIYTDYSKATNAAKGFLATDKYYKANLPHPNLKYGTTTDLRSGVIDFKTNPKVKEVRDRVMGVVTKTQQQLPKGFRPGTMTADAAERMAIRQGRQVAPQEIDDAIFKSFSTGSKATPFFTEVKIRESLKGKTTLP